MSWLGCTLKSWKTLYLIEAYKNILNNNVENTKRKYYKRKSINIKTSNIKQ